MATDPKFYNGNEILLYIDTTTAITTPIADVNIPGNFDLVACLTDNGFDASTAAIDTTTKCLPGWSTSIPGVRSATFSASGKSIKAAYVTADTVGQNQLMALWIVMMKYCHQYPKP